MSIILLLYDIVLVNFLNQLFGRLLNYFFIFVFIFDDFEIYAWLADFKDLVFPNLILQYLVSIIDLLCALRCSLSACLFFILMVFDGLIYRECDSEDFFLFIEFGLYLVMDQLVLKFKGLKRQVDEIFFTDLQNNPVFIDI